MRVLTANRLIDGDVVFYTAKGDWSVDINDSLIAVSEEARARLENIGAKADASAHVVGCYLIEVQKHAGQVNAVHYREIMRTKGPTVRNDLGKQAQVFGSGGLRSGETREVKITAENDNGTLAFGAARLEHYHVSV